MSELMTISAQKRERAGKGGARTVRRAGLVPAVIYGDKQPALNISVEPKAMLKALHRDGFYTRKLAIELDGSTLEVLPRDVQLDPVSDRPVHFDFLRIGPNSVIAVDVPVHFKNEAGSPGIKRGGILNVVHHSIQVRVRADSIPEYFEVDLAGLEIGNSIHLEKIVFPDGVKPTTHERGYTIATIAPPSVMREEAAAPAAAAAAPAADAKAGDAKAPAADAKAAPAAAKGPAKK